MRNFKLKVSILLPLIFLQLNGALAKGIQVLSEKILKEQIGSTNVAKEKEKYVFSYCPDNTCDYLYIDTKNKNFAWDIGFVFLYYQSNYSQIQSFQKNKKFIGNIKSIIKKYKLNCSIEKEYSSCVYMKMLKIHYATQKSVRFDEGNKYEE